MNAGSEVRFGLISVKVGPGLVGAGAGVFPDAAHWPSSVAWRAPDLVTFVARPQYS